MGARSKAAEQGRTQLTGWLRVIVIRMYSNDHSPLHFHAIYGEHEAQIAFDTLEVLQGTLPKRTLALVLEWAGLRRAHFVN